MWVGRQTPATHYSFILCIACEDCILTSSCIFVTSFDLSRKIKFGLHSHFLIIFARAASVETFTSPCLTVASLCF
jgi:hypothetical protein